MIPMTQWKWLGRAGHFCAANRCLHHLHTHVGKFCISTVGDFRPDMKGSDIGKMEAIGYNRYYETFVFRLLPDGAIELSEIDVLAANDSDTADANHMTMCMKYAGTEL